MDFIWFFEHSWLIAIGIIGFFLNTLHGDLKETVKQATENKAKLDLLELESKGKLEQLTKTTEIQISQLAKSIDELAKLQADTNKNIMHLNGNLKHGNEGFLELLTQLVEKK